MTLVQSRVQSGGRAIGQGSATSASRQDVAVLIVGAGFGGLCMGVALRRAGIDSFLIIEKASDLGGTWRDNRYPGCACDVPSHLYSLSFAPRSDWSRMYPTQAELWDYLRGVADEFGLRAKIRLDTAMTSAAWDEAEALWHVRTSAGRTIRAGVVVSAMGALHVPKRPRIPGAERFRGASFHSAEWPDGLDLAGRRVAVIGTGASAIQIVPEIAPAVARLHVFQRAAPWIVPKADRPIGKAERLLFRYLPFYRRAFRGYLYWLHELRALGLTGRHAKVQAAGEAIARRHLAAQVADPRLRDRLTPRYKMGCKRILISNDYYPALGRANVELVTDAIAELRADAVVTSDGLERPVDTIVYATGFEVADAWRMLDVTGRAGLSLAGAWRQEVRSYYGICVNGFPNFFMLLGPNTALGHNSVVIMIEAQVRYIVSCLRQMRQKGIATLEVKAERERRFFDELQARLAPTVWQSGGCHSWYQDQDGHNVSIWPGFTFEYRRRTRRSDLADFHTGAA